MLHSLIHSKCWREQALIAVMVKWQLRENYRNISAWVWKLVLPTFQYIVFSFIRARIPNKNQFSDSFLVQSSFEIEHCQCLFLVLEWRRWQEVSCSHSPTVMYVLDRDIFWFKKSERKACSWGIWSIFLFLSLKKSVVTLYILACYSKEDKLPLCYMLEIQGGLMKEILGRALCLMCPLSTGSMRSSPADVVTW